MDYQIALVGLGVLAFNLIWIGASVYVTRAENNSKINVDTVIANEGY